MVDGLSSSYGAVRSVGFFISPPPWRAVIQRSCFLWGSSALTVVSCHLLCLVWGISSDGNDRRERETGFCVPFD